MRVEVRSRDTSHKLNRSLVSWIEQLFHKLDRYVSDPAYIEVTLEHLHSKRKGGTHYVHALAAVPGEPTTFHAEVLREDFRTACDKVFSKMEHHLRRRRNKVVRAARGVARREKVSRMFQETLHAPRRLLERIKQPVKRSIQ